MDGPGGMEADAATEAIQKMLDAGILQPDSIEMTPAMRDGYDYVAAVEYGTERFAASYPKAGSYVLEIMDHYRQIRRLTGLHFMPTVDKEQALLRLAESEMWLGNARHRVEGPHPRGRRTTVINYGPQYQEGSDGG
jgi:hypothetical protein